MELTPEQKYNQVFQMLQRERAEKADVMREKVNYGLEIGKLVTRLTQKDEELKKLEKDIEDLLNKIKKRDEEIASLKPQIVEIEDLLDINNVS